MNASLGPQAWGLDRGYWDVVGRWREVPEETIREVMQAMGAGAGEPPARAPLVTMYKEGPWPDLPPGASSSRRGAGSS